MIKENKLKTVFSWVMLVLAGLLPIFIYPFIINPLINSKLFLLFSITIVAIFAFAINGIKSKSWKIIKTPFTLPLLAFVGLVLISILVNYAQYPGKQLFGYGGAYLAFGLIVFLIPSLVEEKITKHFSVAMNIAALILSTFSILQLFGFGLGPIISNLTILKLPNTLAFSLTGATLIGIQFLSAVLLSNVFDQKTWKNSLFSKISTIVIAIALGINIWSILPGGEAKFTALSFTNSVAVARNSLTLTKSALFGYGPDSFGNAYNILKPVSINGLDYWQFTFDSAFNLLITLLVSVGVIAFVGYIFFVIKTIIDLKKQKADIFLKTFIITLFVWQLFAPGNFVTLPLLAIALAFYIENNQSEYKKLAFNVKSNLTDFLSSGKLHKAKNIFFMAGNIVLIAIATLILYSSAKSFAAYNFLYKSSVSLNKNEIAKSYDYHKKARILAPHMPFIRRSYSLLNLQIAIALSNKTDISAAEQEQVLQLVNQAINEAKAATILDPINYQNWSVLGQIYMQLLSATNQAQQEAFNALAKAATYNPNNPEIRLALGQLFFSAQNYSDASTFFAQAIEQKPDLFLAYYYLAEAQLSNGEMIEAQTTLANGLSLLDKNSEEYKQVKGELDNLTQRINDSDGAAQKETLQLNNLDTDEEECATCAAKKNQVAPNQDSGLSELLDQQETESIIQESALTPDQNLVEN